MPEPTRKLAAILAADVVGYSRLIAEDEARTLDALRALRRELFEPLVAEHRGEVVKRMGDGWLVSFGSVVDAAQCAIQVQERLAGHDRIKLRIGVHLGDIVHEDEDIYGDGVNVAARLQEVAEPGGVLISGMAYESLVGRLDGLFEDAGTQRLKNVVRPIWAWRWQKRPTGSAMRQVVSAEKPPPSVDKLSIVILPFVNMSNDPEQEFLADGIAEDITTALSKFGSLFVISRTSAFTFKGQDISIADIACELGVRYVVEGSVRRAGNRVRSTAQLVEATSGNHLWAQRFDGDLDEVFELQVRIVTNIVGEVAPEIDLRERELIVDSSPNDLNVWALMQRSNWHWDRKTEEGFQAALQAIEQAISLSPNLAYLYGHKARVLFTQTMYGFTDNAQENIALALMAAKQGMLLDPRDPVVRVGHARVMIATGDADLALQDTHAAIQANPNMSEAYTVQGVVLLSGLGQPEAAIEAFETAMRLSPRDPWGWVTLFMRGSALRLVGRYEEAVASCRKACMYPVKGHRPLTHSAAAKAAAGNLDRAEKALEAARLAQPKLSVAFLRETLRNFNEKHRDSLLSELRKAGLPETADG